MGTHRKLDRKASQLLSLGLFHPKHVVRAHPRRRMTPKGACCPDPRTRKDSRVFSFPV